MAHFHQDFYTNFTCKIVENPTAEADGPSRSQLRKELLEYLEYINKQPSCISGFLNKHKNKQAEYWVTTYFENQPKRSDD